MLYTGADLMTFVRAEGPEKAMLQLYNMFDSILYKNSIKHLKTPPCVDPLEHSLDIKQDTWLSAFLDLRKFHAGEKDREYEEPLGWLLTINRNNCFNHLRNYQKPLKIFSPVDIETFQDSVIDFTTPLDQILEEERRLRLLTIVSSMPSKEQKVLKLYWKGIPHKVIAVMLGTTHLYSRQILCRALRRLQKQIGRGENQ